MSVPQTSTETLEQGIQECLRWGLLDWKLREKALNSDMRVVGGHPGSALVEVNQAITVLADKIRSNIFRAVFWTPGLAPVIFSYYLCSLSCSPGSEDSKLVLHFSVALLLSILRQF